MEEWNTLLDTKYKMKYWSRYDNICEVHVKKFKEKGSQNSVIFRLVEKQMYNCLFKSAFMDLAVLVYGAMLLCQLSSQLLSSSFEITIQTR